MTYRRLPTLLLVPVLALSACGSKSKPVNVTAYTCAQFNKSLNTKGDNSAGNYINQLRKRAKLGRSDRVEHNEIAAGVFFACRNKPGSSRPAAVALATAKAINSGKFKAPTPPKSKKKSG